MSDENQNTENQSTVTVPGLEDKSPQEIAELADRLKKENEATRKRASEAAKKLAEYEATISQMPDKDKLDAFEKWQKDQKSNEEEILRKSGEFDKLMEQKTSYFQEQIEKINSETENYKNMVKKLAVDNPIKSALAKAGVKNIDAALTLINQSNDMKAVYSIEKNTVEIFDGDGTPKFVGDGKPATVDDMVSNWLNSETGNLFIPPSGDSGSGAVKTGQQRGLTYEDVKKDDKLYLKMLKEQPDLLDKLEAEYLRRKKK